MSVGDRSVERPHPPAPGVLGEGSTGSLTVLCKHCLVGRVHIVGGTCTNCGLVRKEYQ